MTANRVPIKVVRAPEGDQIYVYGLRPNNQSWGTDEAQELYDGLGEALDLHAHMPDGCEDDSCPCIARRESQKEAR